MRILIAGLLATLGVILAADTGIEDPYALLFIGLFILLLWSVLK
jgi:hypothetical protein